MWRAAAVTKKKRAVSPPTFADHPATHYYHPADHHVGLMKTAEIHWHRLILILIVVTILFGIGLFRIEIDSDIVASLPEHDPVISDANTIPS